MSEDNEWCKGCKEYDKEKHCCPRWNKVIRNTVEELKLGKPKGKWKRRLVDSGFSADWHCSECGWKTALEEHGYNFCPNCGADMRGGEDGND